MHEWDVVFSLQSSYGFLYLNQTDGNGRKYVLVRDGCLADRGLRVEKDNVPQGNGWIFHRRFTEGAVIRLQVSFWENDIAACGEASREMEEELMKHLDAMLNGAGRLFWAPTSYTGGQRMLDEARWLSWQPATYIEGGLVSMSFELDSQFPYVIDAAQQEIALADGVPTLVTNPGNAHHHPVIQVDGPTSAFTISNTTTNEDISYDSALPGGQAIGAGDIAEFDTFQEKVYLGVGGPPGDDDNLKAGVDPSTTDYFSIAPGANTVEINGADATMLFNPAWIP